MAQQAQEDASLHSVASPALSRWHPDPTGRFQWRYWDGTQWTDWVARDGVSGRDQFVSGPGAEEQQKLAYLRAYVAGAVARGVLPKKAAAALDADAANWQSVPEFGPPASIDLRPDQATGGAGTPAGERKEPPQREPGELEPGELDSEHPDPKQSDSGRSDSGESGAGGSESEQVASEWSAPTWLAPDRWSGS